MDHIYALLHELGISAKYKGYYHMALAVELAMEDEKRLEYVTKRLYPDVARAFGTTPNCVERDLRTAVSVSWRKGGQAALERMSGCPLNERPATAEFVDILVNYLLRRKELDVLPQPEGSVQDWQKLS